MTLISGLNPAFIFPERPITPKPISIIGIVVQIRLDFLTSHPYSRPWRGGRVA